jgi:tRNA-2-methylthio-N6-dimethylallyladenosine synthase
LSDLFFIKTFGCQMNKYDSDSISQALTNSGYEQTQRMHDAHVIMINTCAVREKAESKALTFIGRLSPLKRRNPDRVIGIIGCVAQDKGMELFQRFPYLDLVLGPRNIHRVNEYLSRIKRGGERICAVDIAADPVVSSRCNGFVQGRVTSFLKIMEGCDNFCTYCIVPYVRGRERSVPAKRVIDEATYLVSHGIKEITLIGQNVNSYNAKGNGAPRFPGLLREVDGVAGLKRLRFTTSHPKDLSDELICCFGDLHSLCSHIHLPVQSGSDKVLSLMRRGYTRDTYTRLIERIRNTRPDIAITSDMIVGFPGERETDFEESLRLIEEIKFDNLFSFRYSERPRTAASRLPDRVDEGEKQRRLHALQERQREITMSKNRLLEGTTQEILVEGAGKRGGDQLTGRTSGNKVVNFPARADLKGRLVEVRIIEGFQNSLLGELVDRG